MSVSLPELLRSGPVLTDGAWGTQLQARGLAVGECPDVWNLSHPERVLEVAQAYIDAGSQVILTNTFGANRIRLAGHARAGQIDQINRAGVEISKKAAAGKAYVFASIGPTGKMLLMGDVTEADLSLAFTEQAKALAAGGADALVVETMSDLAEAKIALAAAKSTGLPVVACMVFDSGQKKDRTMMGNTPEEVAQELTAAGADVVGANCGQEAAGYIPICQRLHAATTRPIWIKANAGLPEMIDGKPVYHTAPDEFASHVAGLVKAGALFVGGCCGTNPDFIRAVKRVLSS